MLEKKTNDTRGSTRMKDMKNLSGRSFNIRVSFDAAGAPVLGFVHGMYEVSEGVTEIKRIPEAEHLIIAQSLGIRSSSVHCSVNRALRRCTDVQPEDRTEALEAVSC